MKLVTWFSLAKASLSDTSDDVDGGTPTTSLKLSTWPPRFNQLVPLITYELKILQIRVVPSDANLVLKRGPYWRGWPLG